MNEVKRMKVEEVPSHLLFSILFPYLSTLFLSLHSFFLFSFISFLCFYSLLPEPFLSSTSFLFLLIGSGM